MSFLIAILCALPPADHPLIDEGPRWESATLIQTADKSGPKQAWLIFWRRDSFGRIWPAGETDWNALINWHADDEGYRFTWHDCYAECYRTLRVPRLDYVGADLDSWRVSWPTCPVDMRGFLPNPEKRDE